MSQLSCWLLMMAESTKSFCFNIYDLPFSISSYVFEISTAKGNGDHCPVSNCWQGRNLPPIFCCTQVMKIFSRLASHTILSVTSSKAGSNFVSANFCFFQYSPNYLRLRVFLIKDYYHFVVRYKSFDL